MWKPVWRLGLPPYIRIYIVNVCACKHTTVVARAFNNNNNNNDNIRFGPFDYWWKTKQKFVFVTGTRGCRRRREKESRYDGEQGILLVVFFFLIHTNVFVRGVWYARLCHLYYTWLPRLPPSQTRSVFRPSNIYYYLFDVLYCYIRDRSDTKNVAVHEMFVRVFVSLSSVWIERRKN